MKTIHLLLAAGALAAPGVVAAQATGGVAVADLQAAITNSKAFQAAAAQIRSANAATVTQLTARQQAAQTELKPLADKLQADQRANVPQATLQQEYANLQTRENAANADLQRLRAPLDRAQAYVLEQIQPKLQQAANAAMTARGVTVLLKPEAVVTIQPTADLTPAITAQLDTLVPSVNATPPAGYVPGQAGAAGAAPTTGAAAPTAPAATSRGRRNTGR